MLEKSSFNSSIISIESEPTIINSNTVYGSKYNNDNNQNEVDNYSKNSGQEIIPKNNYIKEDNSQKKDNMLTNNKNESPIPDSRINLDTIDSGQLKINQKKPIPYWNHGNSNCKNIEENNSVIPASEFGSQPATFIASSGPTQINQKNNLSIPEINRQNEIIDLNQHNYIGGVTQNTQIRNQNEENIIEEKKKICSEEKTKNLPPITKKEYYHEHLPMNNNIIIGNITNNFISLNQNRPVLDSFSNSHVSGIHSINETRKKSPKNSTRKYNTMSFFNEPRDSIRKKYENTFDSFSKNSK